MTPRTVNELNSILDQRLNLKVKLSSNLVLTTLHMKKLKFY